MSDSGAVTGKGFRLLLAGKALSMFGDTVLFLALAIWAKGVTGRNAVTDALFFAFSRRALDRTPVLAAPIAKPRLRRDGRSALTLVFVPAMCVVLGGVVVSMSRIAAERASGMLCVANAVAIEAAYWLTFLAVATLLYWLTRPLWCAAGERARARAWRADVASGMLRRPFRAFRL
jgi:hypothetical protein